MSQHLPALSGAAFEREVLASPVPFVVEFGAAWCAPCRVVEPRLAALAAQYGERARFAACDADANPELATRYDVRSLPTVLVFKNGAVVSQLVGAAPQTRLEAAVQKAFA